MVSSTRLNQTPACVCTAPRGALTPVSSFYASSDGSSSRWLSRKIAESKRDRDAEFTQEAVHPANRNARRSPNAISRVQYLK